MPTINTNQLMTCSEAAAELGIMADSVKKYCQKGTIQAIKLGRSWMIEKKEVRRYKRENLGNHGREE